MAVSHGTCNETDQNKPQIVTGQGFPFGPEGDPQIACNASQHLFLSDILKDIWKQLYGCNWLILLVYLTSSTPPFIHYMMFYLHVSTPTFFITTVMADEVPSSSVPKSTLDGRSWKPLIMTFGSVREIVRHFLLTGSSTDRNWNKGFRVTCVNVKKRDNMSTVFEREIERLREVCMWYFRVCSIMLWLQFILCKTGHFTDHHL